MLFRSQMLAIFANMCIGGGLMVKNDIDGKLFVGCDDKSSLVFRTGRFARIPEPTI